MVRDLSPVVMKFQLETGFIGESDGSSFAVFNDASQAGSSMDVDATQAGSFANLCAGDGTKVREVLHSLLVGERSMFRLNPYIVAQIAAFHGCELPVSLHDHAHRRSRLLLHFLSGSCVHHRCSSSATQGCSTFAVGFSSETDMVGYVLDVLLNADGRFLSTENLLSCVHLFGLVQDSSLIHGRNYLHDQLLQYRTDLEQHTHVLPAIDALCNDYRRLSKGTLFGLASFHGLLLSKTETKQSLKEHLMSHITNGSCVHGDGVYEGCNFVLKYIHADTQPVHDVFELKIRLLEALRPKLRSLSLRHLLHIHGVSFENANSLTELRRVLKQYICLLKKSKQSDDSPPHGYLSKKGKRSALSQLKKDDKDREYVSLQASRRLLRERWPPVISDQIKDEVRKLFKESTSSEALQSFTCASCAEQCLLSERQSFAPDDIDLRILQRPDRRENDRGGLADHTWLSTDCRPDFPHDFDHCPQLQDVLIAHEGITELDSGGLQISLCRDCASSIKRGKLPATAIANHNFLGSVPPELQDLTIVEEAMIARCRSKCWVIHLKEENQNLHLPHSQRGLKGHVIVYPQDTSAIADILPPSMDELTSPICVLFVGSSPPSVEWLRTKAQPLIVRRERVRNALDWLLANNTLYRNIRVNHELLDSLETEQVLPVHIQHVVPNSGEEMLTSRYDAMDVDHSNSKRESEPLEFHYFIMSWSQTLTCMHLPMSFELLPYDM